jgi:hypothetical protein
MEAAERTGERLRSGRQRKTGQRILMGTVLKGRADVQGSESRFQPGVEAVGGASDGIAENVSALARELRVLRKGLYKWRDNFRARGQLSRARDCQDARARLIALHCDSATGIGPDRRHTDPNSLCFLAERNAERGA